MLIEIVPFEHLPQESTYLVSQCSRLLCLLCCQTYY